MLDGECITIKATVKYVHVTCQYESNEIRERIYITENRHYPLSHGGHNGGLACLDIMTIKVVIMVDWRVWIS